MSRENGWQGGLRDGGSPAESLFVRLPLRAIPSSVMVLHGDEPCRLVYMNDRMLRELGFEVSGERGGAERPCLSSSIHPDDLASFRECMSSAAGARGEGGCRCRIRGKDRGYLRYEMTAFALAGTAEEGIVVCICENISDALDRGAAEDPVLLHGALSDVGKWRSARYVCTEGRQLEDNPLSATASTGRVRLSAGVMVKKLGLENSPRYASEGVADVLGYPMHELERMFVSRYEDVIHPGDYQAVSDAVARCKEDGPDRFEMEFRFLRRDGSVVWARESASRMDDPGAGGEYLVVLSDVTRLKESEEMLRMREEEVRMVASYIGGVVARYFVAEKEMHILRADCTPEVVGNMPYGFLSRGIICPESVESYSNLFERADRGEGFSAEIRAKGQGGREYWFRAESSAVLDSCCAPVSAVILFSDVTEAKRSDEAAKALKESEQLFRTVMEGFDGLVLRYSFDSDDFEPCTRSSRSLFEGMERPYSAEKMISSLSWPKRALCDLSALYVDMRAGVPRGAVHVKTNARDERQAWYECSFATVFDDWGSPRFSAVLCKDVTVEHEDNLASQRFREAVRPGLRGTEANLEYDLTTDSLEHANGDAPTYLGKDMPRSYSNAIARISCLLPDGDRAEFASSMSRDSLLSSFAEGANSGTRKVLVTIDDEPAWIQIYYQAIEDPLTNHVRAWLSFRNIDEEMKRELRLAEMAQIDPMTGICNRAGFEAEMEERALSPDWGAAGVFILLDIDRFGCINDTFGHAYGDSLLRELAQTLRLLSDERDVVGRIGGDEFAVYAAGLSDSRAVERRLRTIVAAACRKLKESLRLTVSAGAAVSPRDGADVLDLYEKADTALCHAKRTGHNKYVMYSEDLLRSQGCPLVSPCSHERDQRKNRRVYIRTFGHFDVFVDGDALLIPNAKAKELLALLVDRRGGYVTSSEIIGCLWDDEPKNKATLARCRKAVMRLREALREYGLEDIVESKKGSRRLNVDLVSCDLYLFLSGKPEYAHLYKGSYMLNYSWGEFSMAELENLRTFRSFGP